MRGGCFGRGALTDYTHERARTTHGEDRSNGGYEGDRYGLGEVPRELWYLLTSVGSRQRGSDEMLRLGLNHWIIEDSHQHMWDRRWDEDIHSRLLERWFSAMLSMPLRGKTAPFAHLRPLAASTDELFSVASSWRFGWL